MFLDNQACQQMTCHYKLSLQCFKCLKSRATRICETENLEGEEDHLRTTFLRNGYPEGFITSAMKLRTGQELGAADIDRSIQPQREDLMHTTVCKGDFRQDSRHLQTVRSTICVPTEDYIYTEGSTHKSEGTTESHGQGCGVPDPLCTVQ